ncbi:MAG: hemolysin family protein [Pseudobdellovibrionaceae bacterium]
MTTEESSQPPSSLPLRTERPADTGRVGVWLKNLISGKQHSESSLRDAIEDYIEEMSTQGDVTEPAINHELTMLSNILELRDRTAEDVMVPRVDIVALDIDTSTEDLLTFVAQTAHHRIPVYRETLDELVGVLYLQDVLKAIATQSPLILKNMIREACVVSPAMPVFDLLLMMNEGPYHMVFVVDEYGGIDGLITKSDVTGSIIGEVQSKFDKDISTEITSNSDGTYSADARIEIGDFEEKFGAILSEEDRDMADTLGGFIFTITGRVPARGEIVRHDPSGFEFEILEADPRRILKIRIRPTTTVPNTSSQ